jgi:hypothetical protein
MSTEHIIMDDHQITQLEQLLKAYKQRRRSITRINKSLAHLAHEAGQADLLHNQRRRLINNFKTAIMEPASTYLDIYK